MTVLEQILAVAAIVLIIVIGLQRTHIRESHKLLIRARAERASEIEENSRLRGEMIASTHGRTIQITDMTARLRGTNEGNPR